MTLQEGPAFGALIIGSGVAFLVHQKTQNMPLSLLAGAGVAIADYGLVIFIKSITKKK